MLRSRTGVSSKFSSATGAGLGVGTRKLLLPLGVAAVSCVGCAAVGLGLRNSPTLGIGDGTPSRGGGLTGWFDPIAVDASPGGDMSPRLIDMGE